MAAEPGGPERASTPAAASALAQSRGGDAPLPGDGEASAGVEVGPGVERAAHCRPYERAPGEPLFRPLRIYALDPAASVREGAVATVRVPYERVEPGPRGTVFEVVDDDRAAGVRWRPVDLDDPGVLIRDGRDPSPADPRFHQQMAYAVCSLVYAAFRQALGRHVAWGFRVEGDPGRPLRVLPHAFRGRNALYDELRGELRFGYYRADDEAGGRNVPRGSVFTCLSHDVVAHEVTHALLDGLRAQFAFPGGPDVLGFHEGFADLVAVFQHFSYDAVVEAGIREGGGRLDRTALLTGLARQFGQTTGSGGPLRSAIAVDEEGAVRPVRYDPAAESHAMGSVLVSAAFDAFARIFALKTARYLRLATGGTGVLPAGEMPADLRRLLADRAGKTASQFLSLCIRAVDYCPPVDIRLGEYLRAVLTADHDLVPEDPWGYREAWIDAFAARGIHPPNVRSLAEDELRWKPPARPVDAVPGLSFARLRFRGDPANAADADELRRQARALERVVLGHLDQFGMAAPDDPALRGDAVGRPVVHSVRSSRRVGPDGQVVFDLVAEVTQRRDVARGEDRFPFYGGATVILGPDGGVRYVIAKNVLNEERLEEQRAFVRGAGRRYWRLAADGGWEPAGRLFGLLHGGAEEDPSGGDAERVAVGRIAGR